MTRLADTYRTDSKSIGERKGWPWARPSDQKHRMPTSADPLVSVVMPSFNQGEFLDRAIQSVLLQGYPKYELIVIDGGSSDRSVDVLRQYAPQLAFWSSERDRGQCEAINKGFSIAKGEILCWLNSDDMFEPNALFEVVDHFRSRPDSMIVAGSCYCVDEYDRFIDPLSKVLLDTQNASSSVRAGTFEQGSENLSFWFRDWFPQSSTFWRRALWERTGGLDESLHYSMDYELWRRMAQHSEIDVLRDVLSRYRYHADAKCMKANWAPMREVLEINRRTMRPDEFGAFAEQAMKLLLDRVEDREERVSQLNQELVDVRASRSYRLGTSLLRPLGYALRRLGLSA